MGEAFQAAPNESELESSKTLKAYISGTRAAREDQRPVLESS